ncbi:MAG: LysE family translocator [Nitrospirae bacterium]|nr:LysE family translocator [Nitrospirota bacterium]MBI3595329.1 LysE family translocator [Nitrospirota bacterium]
MSQIDWIGFIPASVAVILAPGPGSLWVARVAASSGNRAAGSAMLGILTGDVILVSLSLLGVSALFSAYPALFHAFQLAGTAYLIYLGLKLFLTTGLQKQTLGLEEISGTFKKGVTITLSNPKAIFFFMAFFPLFLRSGGEGFLSSYATMTLLFLGANQVYLFFLSRIFCKVGAVFQENLRLQKIARKTCGIVFIFFGIKIAFFTG